MPANPNRTDRPAPREELILILSSDVIAAALLGGLVETLGYTVEFARAPESPDDSLRRVRPRICLVDSGALVENRGELLGRAMMRGISVIIFGAPAALARVRDTARAHNIEMLLMPTDASTVEAALQRAVTA